MPALGVIVAVLVVVVDQLSKWWILDYFATAKSIVEVTPFFNIVLVMNRGMSFGLVPIEAWWGPWLFAGIAAFIVAILTVWLARAERMLPVLAIGLVIGGAVGNAIDRLRHGGVVDFFDFYFGTYHWPAFNAADTAIVCGVAALIYVSLFQGRDRQYNEGPGK